MGKVTNDNIGRLLRSKKLDADQKERIENVARSAEILGEAILRNCPESADATHALRQVRDAKFWAVESIANKGEV